jgi:polysaccharide biosynthesis/export protein
MCRPAWAAMVLCLASLIAGAENKGPDRAQLQQSAPAAKAPVSTRPDYVLGISDQISVWALGVEEFSNIPVRIGFSGDISLPLVGRMHVAGLTIEKFEDELRRRLATYVREPQVTVSLVEMRSQPVSVVGAVNQPGVHQVQGNKNIVELISLAQGLRNDAGNTIVITRRPEWGPIPLATATTSDSGFYVAKINVKDIMSARNPADNIEIKPNDVITVPKADVVYVIGEVRKAGGFVLNERENVSVLKALSLAEGLTSVAASTKAKILRSAEDGRKTEIAVNLKRILQGQDKDVTLMAEDVLFVPNSAAKRAFTRGAETALQIGTGIVIWRR